eukprot:CAMPEP_0196663020 /NCGR_PEP_ID=MMETSP1086-20130531/51197_1 /TAXON_ID=77921 /ORGANISM="Cyanoptyche  gloeocystis , Strain SAG4.97" /LENGTH=83 /DNA_ID=CAMNT_0041998677 /DNA_START=554 /DNA_END=805 /DNA_ORIENTATION=+
MTGVSHGTFGGAIKERCGDVLKKSKNQNTTTALCNDALISGSAEFVSCARSRQKTIETVSVTPPVVEVGGINGGGRSSWCRCT